MTARWHLKLSLGLHCVWGLVVVLSFALPLYHIEVRSRQDCDVLVNSVEYSIKRPGASDLRVSSTFHDFRVGLCSEAERVCSELCDYSGRFAAAGVLYSVICTLTVLLIFIALLHLIYLVNFKAIAFRKIHYVHLSAASSCILSGALHMALSGGIALSSGHAGSGTLCTCGGMLLAALAGGHFLYLSKRGYQGPPELKYTEVEGTHMSMDAGRHTNEELQIELTEPQDDRKLARKELDDLQNRFQALEDMRKSLMADNQSLTQQLGERDKVVHELEQKVLRSQNNVQVTAALHLAKQKDEEANKLMVRLRDSDDSATRLVKAVEELRAKLGTEGHLREEKEAELRASAQRIKDLTEKLAEAEAKSHADASQTAQETREYYESHLRETIAKERAVWTSDRKKLEEEVQSLQHMVASLKEELSANAKQDSAVQAAKHTAERQLAEATQFRERLEKDKRTLEADLDSLKGELHERDRRLEALQNAAKETESALVSKLRKDSESLRAEVKRLKEAADSAIQEHQSSSDSERSALQSQVEAIKQEAASTKAILETQLQNVKKEAETERKALQTQLSDFQQRSEVLLSLQQSKLAEEQKQAEEGMAALQKELLEERAKAGSAVASLQAELSALKQQFTSYQTTQEVHLSALKSQSDTAKSALKSELGKCQEQVSTLKSERDSAQKVAETLRKEKESIQQQVLSLISEHDSVTQEKTDLEIRCEQSERVAKTLREELESERKRLQGEVEQGKSALQAKEAELAKAISKTAELMQQKNDATAKFFELINEHEELKREKEELEQRLPKS